MKTVYLKKLGLAGLVAMLMLSAFAVLVPGAAQAHGKRTLAGGKYQIVVGFLAEPAFAGVQNGIDLRICQGECRQTDAGADANPVKDADKTLKAEVIYGSQTFPLQLTPRYKADGRYNGVFFPTKAGEYTFRFYGTINGDAIDERMVSGKDGFGSVEDQILFPAADNASNASNTAALQQQVKDAKDSAASATTFGIVGLVAGVLGLVLGGIAVVRRPKAVVGSALESRETVGSGVGRGPQGG